MNGDPPPPRVAEIRGAYAVRSPGRRLLEALRGRWGQGAFVLGFIFIVFLLWPNSPSSTPAARFAVSLPQPDEGSLRVLELALSPNGKWLAFLAEGNGFRQLYLRSMNGAESRPLTGTRGARAPFFSPDNLRLGFYSDGALKFLSLNDADALPEIITTAPQVFAASWGPEDQVVFAPVLASGLWSWRPGGDVEPMTELDVNGGDVAHLWPSFVPGGLLYTVWRSSFADARVVQRSLDNGTERILIDGGAAARYIETDGMGAFVFLRDGEIHALRTNPAEIFTPTETTTTIPIVRNVKTRLFPGVTGFALTADGSLLTYLAGEAGGSRQLVLREEEGGLTPLRLPAELFRDPTPSPDGQSLALTFVREQGTEIWEVALADGTLRRLTSQANSLRPCYSPDGAFIYFASDREGSFDVYRKPLNGGAVERVIGGAEQQYPAALSPDGQTLLYTVEDPLRGVDLWTLRNGRKRSLLRSLADETHPIFSEDGRFLAYALSTPDSSTMIVRQLSRGTRLSLGIQRRLKAAGIPIVWSENKLYYRTPDHRVMALVSPFDAGPVELFHDPLLSEAAFLGDSRWALLRRAVGGGELRGIKNIFEVGEIP